LRDICKSRLLVRVWATKPGRDANTYASVELRHV